MSTHRRSGSAFFEYIHEIGFIPKTLVMAGVGISSNEGIAFKEMWPKSELIGIEPNPHSCQGIRETWPGALFERALSTTDNQLVDLHFSHSWKNGSSLIQPEAKPGSRSHTVPVKTMTLDSLIPFSKKVQKDKDRTYALWLDVEGSELSALKGGVELLKQTGAINIELTGRPRSPGWVSPMEVHSFLSSNGFVQVYIHTIRTVRGQFDAIYVHETKYKADMCAVMPTVDRMKHLESLR